MPDSCHTPCGPQGFMAASSMCCLMVGTGIMMHRRWPGATKATGARSASGQSFQGWHLATLHPSTSVRVTIVPSSNLAETRPRSNPARSERHRQNFATTALGCQACNQWLAENALSPKRAKSTYV